MYNRFYGAQPRRLYQNFSLTLQNIPSPPWKEKHSYPLRCGVGKDEDLPSTLVVIHRSKMADVVLRSCGLRVIRSSYGRTWSGTRLLRTATAAHTGNFKMLWLTLVKDRPGIKNSYYYYYY